MGEAIGWIIIIAILIVIVKFLFTTPIGWAIIAASLLLTIYYFKRKKKEQPSNESSSTRSDINKNTDNISDGNFKKVDDKQPSPNNDDVSQSSSDSEEYVVESHEDEIPTDLPIKVTMVSQLVSSRKPSNKKIEDIYDKYNKIRKSEPRFEQFFGRRYDAPAYTDKYDTGTEFSLRELLLLVWYSRVKKGRMITAKIPNYFFNQYNINGNKLTQRFIDKGWLKDKDARYHLSDEGKQIADFYADLWELHKVSGFPICLDEDFPRWNNGQLLKKFYKREVNYLHSQIDFYNKLIWFYKTYPDFFGDKENQQDSIKYTQQSIDNIQNEIKSFNEKINAI